ncbi:MAG: hypothetical protein R2991_14460 [Thermoanaerobaculia bacterium]
MSRRLVRSRGAAAVLAAGALFQPVVGSAEETGGAETPEAVYARVVAAAESEDVGEIFACLAPEERAETTMMMVAMTGFMVGMAGMAADMGGEMGDAFAEGAAAETAESMAAQKAAAAAEAAALSERWEGILDRHGLKDTMTDVSLDDTKTDAVAALAGVDQTALINDLMAFLDDIGEENGSDVDPNPLTAPVGELEDLVVDGDRATARVGEEEVRFVRVDGRWYLSMGGLEELD